MHKPLEGIRVLEWGIFYAGPAGSSILGDMGAEVIKIERPGTGDPSRQSSTLKDIDFSLPNGSTIVYEGANRSKKSLTLDLADQAGRQIAHNLVKKSDVFFTNLRSSTIDKMHMDYQTLLGINPKLIYASVTGYGSRGPDSDLGAFDSQSQGRSGLMYSMGEPDMPPLLAQFGLIDQATAIMASYQVVIALLMRERFGIGQKVEVSLLGSASYLLYFNNLTYLLTGREVPRNKRATDYPLRNHYQCQDGKWVVMNQQDKGWGIVCELLGYPELADDPRYDNRKKRMEASGELVSMFSKAFITKPRDEWLRLFGEKRLVMCAVNTTPEALSDAQMTENDYVVDFEHPNMGRIRIPGFPIYLSQAKVNNNLLAPKLGEHTYNVLKEVGGYNDEEIARFRENGVI